MWEGTFIRGLYEDRDLYSCHWNTEFDAIPVKNVIQIIKIPNLGGSVIWVLYLNLDLYEQLFARMFSTYREYKLPIYIKF